jgi:trk system potassium uptake protein TrkA
MHITVVGIGEVGRHLSGALASAGHAVTVVDRDRDRLSALDNEMDVRVIEGNGSSAAILKAAFQGGCDCCIAMTSIDEVNLIACSLAKALGVPHTIGRIHDQTLIDSELVNYSSHFGVDLMLNPEALCAAELAKSIRSSARIAVENFARGRIQAQRLTLHKGSRLTGKKLMDLSLPA